MDTPADRDRLAHVERLVDAIDLPIGRWVPTCTLTFCNTPYLHWAGRPREQLLGRTLPALYGEAAWTAARAAFAAAFAGGTVHYERLLTHRPGPPRWVRVQAFPDRDASGRVTAIYTIAFDIHDLIGVQEELRAAQRRLDRFSENIPYPLTYVDRSFVLRFVNRAYARAAGLRAEDLLGRHIGEVRGAVRWAEHRPFFERALAGEVCEYTRLAELAHLGRRWVRTTYSPDFDEAGQVVGIYTSTVDVHDLTLAQQALQHSLERDALTDVLSRRALMDVIEVAVAQAQTEPVALFFLDLDGFKQINDALGHRAGDEALIAVARALRAAVRAQDAVGRFGGDEFLVVARLPDAAAARTMAEHLLAAVRDCAGEALPLAASVGYALAPPDAASGFDLVRRADEAMYTAKRRGKGCAVHWGERTAR
ncbi:MAG: diguanylate cyclase [Burkholderiaceae bacterium]|nr:diguanylate cyclase [Burkholderiaceae bacterium]